MYLCQERLEMKIMIFIWCLIGGLLQCAEKQEPAKQEKHIFDQFKDGRFDFDDYVNHRMTHDLGRLSILQHRVGEILSVYSLNEVLHPEQKKNILQTSNVYNKTKYTYVFSTNNLNSSTEHDYLRIFASYIKFTEQSLHELNGLSNEAVQVIEQMRVHDLYLVSQIVQEDFLPQDASDPYLLPEILYQSHVLWPPKKYEKWVHPDSGSTVIKRALAIRKNKKIDELDLSDFVWEFNVARYSIAEHVKKMSLENKDNK